MGFKGEENAGSIVLLKFQGFDRWVFRRKVLKLRLLVAKL